MWDNIRRLLAPPVFAGDEEKTRVAALLNATLWILIAGAVAFIPIAPFLPTLVQALPIIALLMLVYVASLWLTRRGHVSAATLLLLMGLWATMIAVSVFYGGTQIGSYFASIVVVIAAGLLLGGRWGMAFAGLSIIVGIGIAWAQMTNVLPAPLSPVLPIAQWGILTAFVVAAAGLVDLASRGLNEALLRARGYAAELEKQRAGLEVTVQERTRDLARRARYLQVTAAIAREAELEHILAPLERLGVCVERLRRSEAGVARSPSVRQKFRLDKFEEYFHNSRLQEFSLDQFAIADCPSNFAQHFAPGQVLSTLPLLERWSPVGLLLGLEDATGRCLAVGVIESFDAEARHMSVRAPAVETGRVRCMRIGRSGVE